MGSQNKEVCPLIFFYSFRMSSEEHPTENSQPMDEVSETSQEDPVESREQITAFRPASNPSSSSGKAEERLSAYADQTLRSLAALVPSMTSLSCPQLIRLLNKTGLSLALTVSQCRKSLSLVGLIPNKSVLSHRGPPVSLIWAP